MVYPVRQGERGNLRDLAPEAEPHVAEVLNKIFRERDEAVVDAAPLELSKNGLMLCRIEIL